MLGIIVKALPEIRQFFLSTFAMNEVKLLKKQRYDGRIKKRKWEERRSDYVGKEATEEKISKTESGEKIKRRKYAMLLGYSGVDYFGMQRNPHSKTIEEDLIQAMFKAKLINDDAYRHIQTIQFQRAARTDKGVSAVRQVVSIKLPDSLDVQQINEHLPEQIRVFSAKRVTKGFNSKSQCDARTYAYILPTIAFAHYNAQVEQENFRLDKDVLDKVNELLKIYSGTKNFHNFTSKRKATDPSSNRFIMSFACDPPIVRKGVEFAVLKVKGQSFMLHQIRKMVGLILAIIRGLTSEDVTKQVFTNERVNIPRAPGLGLVLEYVHYDHYNTRYGADGIHEKLVWDEVEDEIDKFKEKYIFPTIIDKEIEKKEMSTWLEAKLLNHRYDAFDERNNDDEEEGSDEEKEEVDREKDDSEKITDVKVDQTV